MATTGRRISEGVVESIEREKGAADEINHGGPVFDRAAVQNEGSVVEIPAVETGGGAVVGSTNGVAAPAATRSTERPAVASTVVDDVLSRPSSSLVSSASATSVPVVPNESGLTPGVLSGRVSTQADGGYAPSAVWRRPIFPIGHMFKLRLCRINVMFKNLLSKPMMT